MYNQVCEMRQQTVREKCMNASVKMRNGLKTENEKHAQCFQDVQFYDA